MKIIVECVVADGKGLEWRHMVERDAVLGAHLHFTKPIVNVFPLDSESRLFERLVEVTAPFGAGFRPRTILDKTEEAQIRFLSVTSLTSSALAAKDQNAVALQIDEMPLRQTTEHSPGVRLGLTRFRGHQPDEGYGVAHGAVEERAEGA